jgi:hypothetical protein
MHLPFVNVVPGWSQTKEPLTNQTPFLIEFLVVMS